MTFNIWRTVTIGIHAQTGEDFLALLKKHSFGIGDEAECFLLRNRIIFAVKESEFNLVKVSVEELGCTHRPTYNEVCLQAVRLGLHECPAQVGPQLRLQYLDQPEGEWLTIGMEPIEGYGGIKYVFGVARTSRISDKGGLSVCHINKTGALTWRPQDVFVFLGK